MPRSTQKNKRVFEEKNTDTQNCENSSKIIADNSKLAREPEKQWETHTNKILKLRREKNI